jgi:hypothetical protein
VATAWAKDQWHIEHRLHDGTSVAHYTLADEITFDRNWNTPSSCTYHVGVSDPLVGRDTFAPYRTDCFIWRGPDLIMSGPHTGRKWSSDNDGVIDVSMQDWMHLLEKLFVPIQINGYGATELISRKNNWISWPADPQNLSGSDPNRNGVYLDIIIRELMGLRNAVDPLQWDVNVFPSGGNITKRAFHTAEGLDNKSMYDHIKELSELHMGFDFDCRYIGVNQVEIRLWHRPGLGVKSTGKPIYVFSAGDQMVRLSWEDLGPKATFTYGTGQGYGNVGRLAAQSEYLPSDATYRRLEATEDVGDIADYYQYDNNIGADGRIIERLTGSIGHRNRGPIHQVELEFDTSILPFSWWLQCDPGDWLRIDYDMGFHRINADYNILGYTATVNENGDELIKPDLERILPYNTTRDDGPAGS